MKTVPFSRFRREFRKWVRYVNKTGEPVMVTHRNKDPIVVIPVEGM